MTTTIPKDIRREFEKKIRRGIFNPVARFLPEEVREDRLQDAICQVWEMYARYAERGELLDDAILVHACRQRATDPSRYFVHCEGYKRKKDVLDPRNYMEGQVEVLHFGDVVDDVDEAPVHLGFAELDTANPTKRIISAISLNEWLEKLSPRDRELIELRAAGYDLDESAEKLGTSRFMVCRRIKELGENLAEHAGMLDCVYRRQWKRSAAGEEAPPESGVQVKTRGRPKKSQTSSSSARGKLSRRVQHAA